MEDRWELEEELVSGRQQIAVSLTTPCTPLRLLLSGRCLRVAQQLRQKSHGNAAALRALQSLEAARPAHQRCDVRANRQWVNMGELFVKLPQRNLERTIAKDQSTIEATIGQLEESEARLRGRLARAGPT